MKNQKSKIRIAGLATGDGGSGYSSAYTYPSGLMPGWNELDIDLATAYNGYNFADLKSITFEGLQDETKPMSFANILFYNGDYTADEPEQVSRSKTSVENVEGSMSSKSSKYMREGQLIIERNNIRYNAQGQVVE